MITLTEILDAIASGDLDDRLDHVVNAVQRRRDAVASMKLAQVHIGDQITIATSVTPKLLAGAPCEIVGFEGASKVKVRLLSTRSAKWRSGMTVTLPKSLIG